MDPHLVVLTKIDKVSRNVLADRSRRITEKIDTPPAEPLIPFSVKTGAGRELLWRKILEAVE